MKVVRLSVNLSPDVAEVLKRRANTKGISLTEAVRRAIAVWDMMEDEKATGNQLATIERTPNGKRVREIVLAD